LKIEMTRKIYKKEKNITGISLIETIIYITITTIVLVFIVNLMLSSSSAFKNFKVSRDIKNSAIISIDRIVNETRKAVSVDDGLSLFNNPNGKLTLNMPDGSKMVFFLDSGILKIENDGVIEGSLSLHDVFISSLIFKMINNTKGKAIKIEMNIRDKENDFIKSENFFMTVILQGSY